MSSSEYLDLYFKSQKNQNSRYHVFTFDIANSKELNQIEYLLIKNTLYKIINNMFELLKETEFETNNTILAYRELINNSNDFVLNNEPFIFGDMIGFTIYKDSLSSQKIMQIFDKIKNNYNFNYTLHCTNGYYETNNYEEGKEKLFRGYCIDILSNIHKKEYDTKILSIKKKY